MTCVDKEGKGFSRDKEHEPLGFKFRLIHEGFANMLNKQLRDEDMTFSQMILVSYLWENKDKKVTQKDISQALQIKHPTTIGLLKRLEDKEMVKVVVDPDNRKYRNIAITSKGEEFIIRSKERRSVNNQVLVDGLSDEEITQLRYLLDKVIDNMNKL
ncbi:MarR family winged helix-turn-helix transcriptional regulator [Butyrivibrio sp. XBB1001]|uniref:MarR family winged helix-turn-helix transcriptional regulator n=1 Tax=Butyrivibrio sp. XBB1001 TaxID=1280682 RepID=UPI00041858EE|nr:MarR family transcriptional regulator [Butyrivibrio sp. XBB1001]